MLLDLAGVAWAMDVTLEGEENAHGQGFGAVPYVGVSKRWDRLGVGLSGLVPYGGGGSMPEDGPQRFHLVEGYAFLLEGDLSLAWEVTSRLQVGGAVRVARGLMGSTRAIDTGAMLASTLGPEAGIPLEEPALEGTQQTQLAGSGLGWGLGISWMISEALELHGAWRSRIRLPFEGSTTLVPSNDMTFEMSGSLETEMVFPPEVELAVALARGDLRVVLGMGWAGWSSLHRVDGEIQDLQVSSPDPELSFLLAAMGVSELDLLDAGQQFGSILGYTDVVQGGVSTTWRAAEDLDLLTAVVYSPASSADYAFSAGVMDVTYIGVGGGVTSRHVDGFEINLSLSAPVSKERVVTNSQLSLEQDPTSGLQSPSGNGRYALQAARLGVSVRAFF